MTCFTTTNIIFLSFCSHTCDSFLLYSTFWKISLQYLLRDKMCKIVCSEDKAFLLGLMAIILLYHRPWLRYHIFLLCTLRNVFRGTKAHVQLWNFKNYFACEDILQFLPFTEVLNIWDINSGNNGLNMFSCMGSQLDMGDRERKVRTKVHCTMKMKLIL